jgi:hypothetical protein
MFELSEAENVVFHKILAQLHPNYSRLPRVWERVGHCTASRPNKPQLASMPGSVVSSVSALVDDVTVASPQLRFRSACPTGKSGTLLHDPRIVGHPKMSPRCYPPSQ